MRFNILLLIIGIAILVVGINLSSLLTTPWIIVGTSTAIFGGTLTGINAYFLASKKKVNAKTITAYLHQLKRTLDEFNLKKNLFIILVLILN